MRINEQKRVIKQKLVRKDINEKKAFQIFYSRLECIPQQKRSPRMQNKRPRNQYYLARTLSWYSSGQDSTTLVREMTRGTKLEGASNKRKGELLEQSNHTSTFLPPSENQPAIIYGREAAKQDWRQKSEVATPSEQKQKSRPQNKKCQIHPTSQ